MVIDLYVNLMEKKKKKRGCNKFMGSISWHRQKLKTDLGAKK